MQMFSLTKASQNLSTLEAIENNSTVEIAKF